MVLHWPEALAVVPHVPPVLLRAVASALHIAASQRVEQTASEPEGRVPKLLGVDLDALGEA